LLAFDDVQGKNGTGIIDDLPVARVGEDGNVAVNAS